MGIHVSSNQSRIIDTESEGRTYGWSDDELEMVEKHLLSHPDFGMKVLRDRGEQRGDELLNVQVWKLWFAPDQDIPEKYQEFCEQQSWYKTWDFGAMQAVPHVSENMCIFTDVVGHSVMRCQEPAVEGQDYCADHVVEMAEV